MRTKLLLSAITLGTALAIPQMAFAQTATPAPSASASTALPKHESCPNGFDAGDAAGVRICRGKGGEIRLETTDPAKSGAHEYTGTLTTDGSFGNVHLVRPENDDSATVDGSGNLNFDFKTFSGIDGVAFDVNGGTKVTFSLFVDGQQLDPAHIWVGHKGKHPKSDPFTEHAGKHKKATPSESATPSASPSA